MSSLLRIALAEILGKAQSGWMDSLEDGPDLLFRIQQALQSHYGADGANGILWRVGRSFYREYLLQLDDGQGILRSDLRFLPFRKKIHAGLAILAETFSGIDGQHIEVTWKDGRYFWRIQECIQCRNQTDTQWKCSFFLGLVQEYISWIGGGKSFLVDEEECISRGAATCILRIDPRPVE